MLSIKEVAKQTGLSIATVSRALDPRFAERVKPATRQKIYEVCNRGNYRPRLTGRSFVTGKSYKVAFISGTIERDFSTPLGSLFFRGLCHTLQGSGFSLLMLGADDGTKQQEQIVIDFLRSGVADAYILGSSMVSDPVYDAVSRCGCPVLVLGNAHRKENMISLRRDALPACRDVWSRIPAAWKGELLYCGPDIANTKEKYADVCQTAPAGLEAELFVWKQPFDHIAFNRELAREGVRKYAQELGKKKLLWCSSDLTALGIMDALTATGLQAGREYYLVGYDNISAAGFYRGDPFLSTIDSGSEARGKKAGELVLRALSEPFCEVVDFPLSFVPRQSFPFRKGGIL